MNKGQWEEESFIDFRSNMPRNNEYRTVFRDHLQHAFERRLPESVDRIWDLPPILLPKGDYLYQKLLFEARELYIAGHFYSCVAMCGIVGERIVKDLIRSSIRVAVSISAQDSSENLQKPSAKAFDQLEHVEHSAMIRFLNEVGLLSDGSKKAAEKMAQMRNQYAHARGANPQADALDSIKHLHVLVEDTVSVFKHFDIKDGALVLKQN